MKNSTTDGLNEISLRVEISASYRMKKYDQRTDILWAPDDHCFEMVFEAKDEKLSASREILNIFKLIIIIFNLAQLSEESLPSCVLSLSS